MINSLCEYIMKNVDLLLRSLRDVYSDLDFIDFILSTMDYGLILIVCSGGKLRPHFFSSLYMQTPKKFTLRR